MGFHPPDKIAANAAEQGTKKANLDTPSAIVLGFLGGAFIAFGYLLYIRVIATMPEDIWGSFATFIGASVFPLGLVLVLIAGAELVTGNMMAVPIARYAGKISTGKLTKNIVLITVMNFVGSIFVAYFFGHVLGLTGSGAYLEETVATAGSKLGDSFFQSFISGIGANWLVCLSVWLCWSADDIAGKILGIWFPIMAFVAIGFQHVVANMFIIPAAIFEGYYSWMAYLENFAAVWLGNFVGGALFVAGFYWFTYLRKKKEEQ